MRGSGMAYASSIEVTTGRGSYWTSIKSRASVATSSSTAATAATGSPTIRTFPIARGCSSSLIGRAPYGVGISVPSRTAWTPAYAFAFETSILMMRACGTVLRRSLVWSIRGSTRSSAYFSSPMHFALASTLIKGFPTTRKPFLWPPLFPAIKSLLRGFGLLASHPRSRELHSFQYFDIAGTAAKVSGKSFLDFITRRPGSVLQKRFRRQQNSGSAISTLSGAEFGERLLQRMQPGSYRHTLNRRDLMPFHRNSESET